MNKALARLVQEEHPQYANDAGDQVRVIDDTSRDTLMSPFTSIGQWDYLKRQSSPVTRAT